MKHYKSLEFPTNVARAS